MKCFKRVKYDLLALRNKEATKTTDSMDYAGVTMATADSAVAERLSIKPSHEERAYRSRRKL